MLSCSICDASKTRPRSCATSRRGGQSNRSAQNDCRHRSAYRSWQDLAGAGPDWRRYRPPQGREDARHFRRPRFCLPSNARRRHSRLCRRAGAWAVAITKSDLVDAGRLAEVRTEIENFLAPTALHDAPMFPVSSATDAGIAELRTHLFALAAAWSGRSSQGRFRLAVDRSFTLPGVGTVVTGTVLSGGVAVGDQVVISPSGKAARVRARHAQNRTAERGQAGDRCALNLAGDQIGKDAIRRGDG